MTAAELEAALTAARAEAAAAKAKLAALKAAAAGPGGGLVTADARKKARDTLDRYRKAWAARKAIVMDVRY
jgi:hypothetical protein